MKAARLLGVRRRTKNAHREDDDQKILFDWARLAIVGGYRLNDYLFAIPNGGKRNIREAARMKAQGVKSGVSDIMLPIPVGGYHGLWIELKAQKIAGSRAGKPNENQILWQKRMVAAGYAAHICYGWFNAKTTIEDYLKQK
jgi:hypothetical protein